MFDLKHFDVSYDAKNLILKLSFNGPIPNPWGSPNNLALQTLDFYIDKDPGADTGARQLLPGRNAALPQGDGWDVALWSEGWTPGVYAPDASGTAKRIDGVDYKIMVDPAAQQVTSATLRELLRLVNQSLLERSPAGRYALHELLRQYAEEQLHTSLDAQREAHKRHCLYFAGALQRWATHAPRSSWQPYAAVQRSPSEARPSAGIACQVRGAYFPNAVQTLLAS